MKAFNMIKSKLDNSNSMAGQGVSSYPLSPHQSRVRVRNANHQRNMGAQVFPQYGLPLG